jgi:hypothetical protein
VAATVDTVGATAATVIPVPLSVFLQPVAREKTDKKITDK